MRQAKYSDTTIVSESRSHNESFSLIGQKFWARKNNPDGPATVTKTEVLILIDKKKIEALIQKF